MSYRFSDKLRKKFTSMNEDRGSRNVKRVGLFLNIV